MQESKQEVTKVVSHQKDSSKPTVCSLGHLNIASQLNGLHKISLLPHV